MTFTGFFKHVYQANLAISVLSLGVILNLALFFLYYQLKFDRSAKGVIAASFIYAFAALYYKVIL